MRLREGVTFEKSKEMLIGVWKKIAKVDWTLIDGENVFAEIEKYWQGSGNSVLDFSVCWLFCYGNSDGRYKKFESEIPVLWKELFDIPYDCFLYFQTAMDGGESPVKSDDRYLHKRRDESRGKIEDFTFYGNAKR